MNIHDWNSLLQLENVSTEKKNIKVKLILFSYLKSKILNNEKKLIILTNPKKIE